MRGESAALPVADAELPSLLRPLQGYAAFALAVSGGPDSMALMALVSRWQTMRGADLSAVTVLTADHGLRPNSAQEASWVAAAAQAAGLRHATLVWEGAKPASGIQAAARQARYSLMASFALANHIPCIVTAHTQEDQAETLAMRLGRGSGLDGLAGMTPITPWGGIDIVRPLLGIPKARLRASLNAAGAAWLDDPSNADDRYERVRVRRALEALAAAGISPASLALSAKRLGRARGALDLLTHQFLGTALAPHPSGYGDFDLAALKDAPEEIAIHALGRAAMAFGGGAAPPRLAKVEALYAALQGASPARATLGGCLFMVRRASLTVCREFGRMRHEPLLLQPGATALWDGRFIVSAPASAPHPLIIRALGEDGLQAARALSGKRAPAPRMAFSTAPSFWCGDALVAAPPLDIINPGTRFAAYAAACRAEFANWALTGRDAPVIKRRPGGRDGLAHSTEVLDR